LLLCDQIELLLLTAADLPNTELIQHKDDG